jgi:hypothetical protein
MLSQGYLLPTPRLSQLHVPLWHGRIPGFFQFSLPLSALQGSPASSAPPRIETDPPAHQLWLLRNSPPVSV